MLGKSTFQEDLNEFVKEVNQWPNKKQTIMSFKYISAAIQLIPNGTIKS